MKIDSIKTHTITTDDRDIFAVLDRYLPELHEQTVVAVTSKIVAITEGSFAKTESGDKKELIAREAEFYIPPGESKYDVSLTIKNNTLVANAGIDESNADGQYVLWPQNPQESANQIREHLAKKFNIKNVGVIITDSKTTPLRWGVTALAIAYSGFAPLKDYIGTPDLFGRPFKFEKLNIADSLASAATVVMGEGSEGTPLAVITEIPFVQFQDRNPTVEELGNLAISIDEDLYAPLLKNAGWKKGSKK